MLGWAKLQRRGHQDIDRKPGRRADATSIIRWVT